MRIAVEDIYGRRSARTMSVLEGKLGSSALRALSTPVTGSVSASSNTELNEHTRLVPVDVLVRELAVTKADDHDERNLDPLSRWSDPREHPVHSNGVSELEDHLIDQPIVADGARDRSELRVRRHLRNEVLRVEVPQRIPPDTSRHHRHVVDVGILHHCAEGRFRVVRRELASDVFLPEIVQDLLGGV